MLDPSDYNPFELLADFSDSERSVVSNIAKTFISDIPSPDNVTLFSPESTEPIFSPEQVHSAILTSSISSFPKVTYARCPWLFIDWWPINRQQVLLWLHDMGGEGQLSLAVRTLQNTKGAIQLLPKTQRDTLQAPFAAAEAAVIGCLSDPMGLGRYIDCLVNLCAMTWQNQSSFSAVASVSTTLIEPALGALGTAAIGGGDDKSDGSQLSSALGLMISIGLDMVDSHQHHHSSGALPARDGPGDMAVHLRWGESGSPSPAGHSGRWPSVLSLAAPHQEDSNQLLLDAHAVREGERLTMAVSSPKALIDQMKSRFGNLPPPELLALARQAVSDTGTEEGGASQHGARSLTMTSSSSSSLKRGDPALSLAGTVARPMLPWRGGQRLITRGGRYEGMHRTRVRPRGGSSRDRAFLPGEHLSRMRDPRMVSSKTRQLLSAGKDSRVDALAPLTPIPRSPAPPPPALARLEADLNVPLSIAMLRRLMKGAAPPTRLCIWLHNVPEEYLDGGVSEQDVPLLRSVHSVLLPGDIPQRVWSRKEGYPSTAKERSGPLAKSSRTCSGLYRLVLREEVETGDIPEPPFSIQNPPIRLSFAPPSPSPQPQPQMQHATAFSALNPMVPPKPRGVTTTITPVPLRVKPAHPPPTCLPVPPQDRITVEAGPHVSFFCGSHGKEKQWAQTAPAPSLVATASPLVGGLAQYAQDPASAHGMLISPTRRRVAKIPAPPGMGRCRAFVSAMAGLNPAQLRTDTIPLAELRALEQVSRVMDCRLTATKKRMAGRARASPSLVWDRAPPPPLPRVCAHSGCHRVESRMDEFTQCASGMYCCSERCIRMFDGHREPYTYKQRLNP
eukprot:gnl/Dysnectes_brevis/2795_a3409_623.p1 GENE.gnl/Dysnectes_brevis/2795_a3409_623~~gnl/Dysnectes_brevis/2795_a3409_623.p1  ORF type:complete len:865 (-),score=163.57 gnl/Dysnectes_brevis/2795_a3409_623:32-2563(-)